MQAKQFNKTYPGWMLIIGLIFYLSAAHAGFGMRSAGSSQAAGQQQIQPDNDIAAQHSSNYTPQTTSSVSSTPQTLTTQQSSLTAPKFEITIAESSLFPRQATLYTLNVFTSGNVKSINATFPKVSGLKVETLVYGKNNPTTQSGKKGFETVFSYALTPLESGEMTIPPIMIQGEYFTRVADQYKAFTLSAGEEKTLNIYPSNAAIKPWLALQSLNVEADIKSDEKPVTGSPLTLTITMEGRGISASELPSLYDHLQGNGYKIYRESVNYDTELAVNGRTIIGKRKEHFMLVPIQGGALTLPETKIQWWDSTLNTARTSALVIPPPLNIVGPPPENENLSEQQAAFDSGLLPFWLILMLIVLPMMLYWIFIHLHVNQSWGKVSQQMMGFISPIWDRTGGAIWKRRTQLTPMFYINKLRYRILSALPPGHKMWYCSKRLDIEDDPREWCQLFQIFATRYLDVSPNSPISQISKQLMLVNPRISPERLKPLAQEMEGHLYGGQDFDFKSWKRKFRKAIRPQLFPALPEKVSKRTKLPTLNPDKMS